MKIGAPKGSAVVQGLSAMLFANNIRMEQIRMVDIGFGVQPLLVKQVDAIMAYTNVQPIQAEGAGMPVNELFVADFGVNAYGTIIVANDEFIAKQPTAIAGFLRATRRAVQEIAGDRKGAAQSVANAVTEIDVAHELKVLERTLPLWAAIAAALPRTTTIVQRYFLITLVLSLVGWTSLARELRGKVMAYRSLDYIAAARLAGSSHLRIILSHMLPNAASHIIVVATLAVPYSILGETTLSFLGLGMLPPAVSWGVLLKDAQQLDSILIHPWMLLPAIPVIVTVAAYFLLGDGLRDAVDPYSS